MTYPLGSRTSASEVAVYFEGLSCPRFVDNIHAIYTKLYQIFNYNNLVVYGEKKGRTMVNTYALWDILEKEFKGYETSCGSCLKQGVIGEDLGAICLVTPGMSIGPISSVWWCQCRHKQGVIGENLSVISSATHGLSVGLIYSVWAICKQCKEQYEKHYPSIKRT